MEPRRCCSIHAILLLVVGGLLQVTTGFLLSPFAVVPPESPTRLCFIRGLFQKKEKEREDVFPEDEQQILDDSNPKKEQPVSTQGRNEVAVCVIGGGVSGLVAATKAAQALKDTSDKVVLLEASPTLGGRVQSDKTEDGFILDRGFAVFIEEYPMAKKLLDYEKLKLKQFMPGALVKIQGRQSLARVADPFRQPQDLLQALLAPVGSWRDKIAFLPLLLYVKATNIEGIFEEPETNTLSALKETWGLGDDMIDNFFKPFLEGIYLAPLQEQSSRMFTFVLRMFSNGSAALPKEGIGAVSEQLANKAAQAGVDLRTSQPVEEISQKNKGGGFLIKSKDGKTVLQAETVICAIEGPVAQRLLSRIPGLESVLSDEPQPQRSVGCLYYTFDTPVPVRVPILILNGIGPDRGNEEYPVNNVCFPSVVNPGYAPEGRGLCSVTILKKAMEIYRGREQELDKAVRKQLATWFPEHRNDILDKWELKKVYEIKNAQPGQLKGPFPANVNGGRDCYSYHGKQLPEGLFVCGDHMATATLNGALESGVNAGKAAANVVRRTRASLPVVAR